MASRFSLCVLSIAAVAITACSIHVNVRPGTLDQILGAYYEGGCQYIMADWENWSRECNAPWGGFPSGCELKLCVGSADPDGCGFERAWTALNEASSYRWDSTRTRHSAPEAVPVLVPLRVLDMMPMKQNHASREIPTSRVAANLVVMNPRMEFRQLVVNTVKRDLSIRCRLNIGCGTKPWDHVQSDIRLTRKSSAKSVHLCEC